MIVTFSSLIFGLVMFFRQVWSIHNNITASHFVECKQFKYIIILLYIKYIIILLYIIYIIICNMQI